MNTTLSKFSSHIDEAIKLIDKYSPPTAHNVDEISPKGNQPALASLFRAQNSLLDKCDAVCEIYARQRPKLRIIHHFACSGGSLISKCLAALPNAFLLSEIHPYSRLHMASENARYSPSDYVTQARYAGIPEIRELEDVIFSKSIDQIAKHVETYGGDLIIREHTHADYCVGDLSLGNPGVMARLLGRSYQVLHLVTVRHPLDAYLSLANNGWLHFEPPTFDQFCRRFLDFINDHDPDSMIKYEDFVERPANVLRQICEILDLQFSDSALDIFDIFSVSGDSGRTGVFINERARRNVPIEVNEQALSSSHYREACEVLGYDLSI